MKCLTFVIPLCLVTLVLGTPERNYHRNKRGFSYNMPEYENPDENVYNYEELSDEDIWEHHVAEDAGVVRITEKIYNEKLLGMK